MRPFLRPLDDSLVLFGRVRTGLYANSYHVDLSKNPCAVEIAPVDDLQTGDLWRTDRTNRSLGRTPNDSISEKRRIGMRHR
jgi:hypothetical protein